MGDDTARTAATKTAGTNLRHLAAGLAELPARSTGPSGRTRSPFAAPAVDLGILAYMTAAKDELVDHTRAAAPDPETLTPVPREEAAVYDWYAANTPHLDEQARRVGEAIIYRQTLESALRAGDTMAIRPERCPSCRCFSLIWRRSEFRAVCINERDADADRAPRRFTLAQLAEKAVENLSIRAAT